MKQVDEKVLSKIKKCLALAQSSEPHEAAAALRQAQKLMEANNVSQMDIGVSEIGDAEVKSRFSVSNIKPYEGNLLDMIAKAFGCKLFFRKGSSFAIKASDCFASFTIIGVKSNVEMAQYTCEVMLRKMHKARVEYTKQLKEKSFARQYITREADGFCMGWTAAVTKTIHEFANPIEVQNSIDTYVANKYTNIRTQSHQNRKLGAAGYDAGKEVGAGESIHKPMNGKDQKRIK